MSIGFPAAAGVAEQPGAAVVAATAPDRFEQVPLDLLWPSLTNPRKHFDQAKLDELAESIRQHGINEPLIVRRVDNARGPEYEIVAGERRFRAARLAGLAAAPCLVRQLSDHDVLEIQAIENLQREDLSPLEEADAFQLLIERNGYDAAGIAAKIGKSASYVHGRLSLRKLCSAGIDELAKEGSQFTLQHAVVVAKLRAEDQEECVRHVLTHYSRTTVADLREYIADRFLRQLTSAPFDVIDASLLAGAGSCTECPKRTGAQRALFEDVVTGSDDADRCLDSECFGQKVRNFVERQRQKIAAKSQEPVLLVASKSTHAANEKGVLRAWDYDAAKKGDAGARQVVVANGPDAGKVIWAKVRAGVLDSPEQRKAAKEKQALRHQSERQKYEIEREAKDRLCQALGEKLMLAGASLLNAKCRVELLNDALCDDERIVEALRQQCGLDAGGGASEQKRGPARRSETRAAATEIYQAVVETGGPAAGQFERFVLLLMRAYVERARQYDYRDNMTALAAACNIEYADLEKQILKEVRAEVKAKGKKK